MAYIILLSGYVNDGLSKVPFFSVDRSSRSNCYRYERGQLYRVYPGGMPVLDLDDLTVKKNQEKIGYCDQCPWMTLEENILCSLLSKTVYQATNKASLSIITAPRIYQAEIIPSDVNENCLKVRRCNKW